MQASRSRGRPANHRRARFARRHHYDRRPLPPATAAKFEGEIDLNAAQSKPAWPSRVVPPKGAPNILLILTDDVGFGKPIEGVSMAYTFDKANADAPSRHHTQYFEMLGVHGAVQ